MFFLPLARNYSDCLLGSERCQNPSVTKHVKRRQSEKMKNTADMRPNCHHLSVDLYIVAAVFLCPLWLKVLGLFHLFFTAHGGGLKCTLLHT